MRVFNIPQPGYVTNCFKNETAFLIPFFINKNINNTLYFRYETLTKDEIMKNLFIKTSQVLALVLVSYSPASMASISFDKTFGGPTLTTVAWASSACKSCREKCVNRRVAEKKRCCSILGGTVKPSSCDSPRSSKEYKQCLVKIENNESLCWDRCKPTCDASN